MVRSVSAGPDNTAGMAPRSSARPSSAPRLGPDVLVAVARRLLVGGGAEAVVVREVARWLSVAPSALYKHVDGRDGLLTLLIARLYEELNAECLAAVAAQPPAAHRARISAAIAAVREWARRNPAEFDLLFGYPVAGYSAPAHGPTIGPARRLGLIFVDTLTAAARDGRLRNGLADDLADDLADELGHIHEGADSLAADLPPDLFYAVVAGWQRILGLVSVEVGGQLAWAGAGAATITTYQLSRLVDEMLTPGP